MTLSPKRGLFGSPPLLLLPSHMSRFPSGCWLNDTQSQAGPLWEPTPSFGFWLNDTQSQTGPLWEPTPSDLIITDNPAAATTAATTAATDPPDPLRPPAAATTVATYCNMLHHKRSASNTALDLAFNLTLKE